MYTQTNQQSAVNEIPQESQNVLRLSFMSCSFRSVDVKYILKEVKFRSRLLSDRGTRETPDGTLTKRDKSPLLFSIHICSVCVPDVLEDQSACAHLLASPQYMCANRTITIAYNSSVINTMDDNYSWNYNYKVHTSTHYNCNNTEYCWNHFQNQFFQLMNDKIFDSQSETTWH